MIVRWGLDALASVLAEVGSERPLLVATERWRALDLPAANAFYGVEPHGSPESVAEATAAADGADGLLAVGGGSAIDTAKAVSAATGLPVVSVPTTYSGAEWTRGFGIRDEARRVKGGGMGAHVAGIVYEPELTYDLPPGESGGTALNALAHCAEALYVEGKNGQADAEALAGAPLISDNLPLVLADGRYPGARRALLEGAMHAGAALAGAGLGLGHAMAQAVGGRYGLPHGALNAICLPPALRFNAEFVPPELAAALGGEPAVRAEELARLAGFTTLGALGVPERDLPELAEAIAARPGARANPREASPALILELLRTIN